MMASFQIYEDIPTVQACHSGRHDAMTAGTLQNAAATAHAAANGKARSLDMLLTRPVRLIVKVPSDVERLQAERSRALRDLSNCFHGSVSLQPDSLSVKVRHAPKHHDVSMKDVQAACRAALNRC